MRRLLGVAILLAVCLAGCSANQDFEKDILGHPAPETPSNGSWGNTPPPPPPPPPAPAYPEPQGNPAPEPAPSSAQMPPAASQAPAQSQYTPKPFTPAPAAKTPPPAQPAPAPAVAPQPAPKPQAKPAPTAPQGDSYTFQVGSFAHAANAKELAGKLESAGYKTRVEPGEVNNRKCFNVFATKSGARAALEGELFASGVAEPSLVGEHHPGDASPPSAKEAAPAAAKAPAKAKKGQTKVSKKAPKTSAKAAQAQ